MTLLASLILLNVGLAAYANSFAFSCVLYGLAMVGIMSTVLCGVFIGRVFIKKEHVMYLVDVLLCFPKLVHLFIGFVYDHAPTRPGRIQVSNAVREGGQPYSTTLYECGMFAINFVANILVDVVKVIIDWEVTSRIRL